ncbi:MAG: hypothetical protein IPL52_02020 [Flavobacteriales bacterium]|nr:hypothetical protein [Flavobacteriales bacterium]
MKKTILSFALLGLCSMASAQLSTRENQDTRYKFGGRPVAGDYGLTFGLTINNAAFGGSSDSTRSIPVWNRLSRGNLITGKKYISNDVAYRAGIRLMRSSRSIKAELDSSEQVPNSLAEAQYLDASREYMIVPGIEKHFNSANIFDVYLAGDLYLGFGRDKSINSTTDRQGRTTSTTMTTPYTIVGLGGVIGVNVFVLDLPVSVGIEYGLSAFWQLGDRTKVEVEEADGDSYEYFTVSNDPFGGQRYSSVKQKYMTMNTNDQVRVVLNLYFN